MDGLTVAWACVLSSTLMVSAYEAWFYHHARRYPLRIARTAHARIRANWVRGLMRQQGQELLAVQTIRNSVMSASVTASTAVLALMGGITLLSTRISWEAALVTGITPRAALAAILIVILFTTFVLSAMAVRFFNHTGYLMGTPASGPGRQALVELAVRYVVRAGNYYSQGMRTLLWLMPVIVGLVSPWLMPVAAGFLIVVLRWFDRTPAQLDELMAAVSEVKE